MKKKVQKVFHDHGFGFPLTLLNVTLIKARGEWIPAINQNELQALVVQALVLKASRLTGNEVRFIRLYSKMTLEKFAERFDVTHPAVLKWERNSDQATGMGWTTEKDIRLFALKSLEPKPQLFLKAYESLIEVAPVKSSPIKIDLLAG